MRLQRQEKIRIAGCAERAQVPHQVPPPFGPGNHKVNSQRCAVASVATKSALEPIPIHDLVAYGVIDSHVFGQTVLVGLAPMRLAEFEEALS